MATEILQTTATTVHQYRLSEADRQAILAKSDFSLKRAEIERQRQRFIELNGSEFGNLEQED